ncbi:hypothetical protein CI109_101914 [Kwoniella shandongensis]|uniref:Uncharacterized protein n=1 Tax=Kwoniella shandongensis TaxID=1734106 RepID=A0A5M6BTI8_9TREE|nr:uncharacterized protein CI109_006786 [Kwoniella shandongensis]KAA5524915.1 hypothetical protein CI109_006786 [Kwoniella shandongensis]
MNDAHYQQQGGYDGRGGDGRERRDEYQQQSYPQQQQQQHQHHQPQQQPQQQQQQQAQSPPTSASPFAFAPPPLSSVPVSGSSRPPLLAHHSEPPVGQQYSYYQHKPQPVQHNTYPYPASASMNYRSYSGETERQSPQQTNLTRTPSLSVLPPGNSVPSQSSPLNGSPFAYQRQPNETQYGTPMSQQQSSPRASGLYPPNYYTTPYSAQPSAADMPRSLSYPSAYTQSYPGYLPSMSAPSSLQQPGHPGLIRHNTMAGPASAMDMRTGPSLGYSFANRLPLVDRPFKCDECVQSFNRNHDLKRHKRIHLSVKPFGCDKCGKTFSRKDALRRHWLVKGCRGEEGATAPITPMYPINSQPPALSPPTPPTNVSPTESQHNGFGSGSSSFSHPSAPPPLHSLPSRQQSDQSQLIVTPDEMAAQQQQMARTSIGDNGMAPALDEPLVLDSTMGAAGGASRGSAGSMEDGSGSYFDGVVGIKQDGTALIDSPQGSASPYARFPTSPSNGVHHHPYRRPMAIPSPGRQQPSPTTTGSYQGHRNYSPSSLGADSKPIFAMPFTPNGSQYTVQQHEGLLAPPLETATKMEKQGSADGPPDTWQRWHRPSFPFPAPPGVAYNFDPSSPIDVGAQGYSQ